MIIQNKKKQHRVTSFDKISPPQTEISEIRPALNHFSGGGGLFVDLGSGDMAFSCVILDYKAVGSF